MITIKQGDCLELMKEIPAGSVDMILTDLPYGITDCDFDKRLPFETLWEEFWRVTKPNAAVVLFGVAKFAIELAYSQIKYYRYEWIWQKSNFAGFLNAKKMPLRTHEKILVFYKKLPTYNPQFTKGEPYNKIHSGNVNSNIYGKKNTCVTNSDGRRYPVDVIKFSNQHMLWGKPCNDFSNHSNQKPVSLLEYLIKTYTNAGETVLDATMGTGSTGVACVNTGRNFIGYELTEKYYEVAKGRIERAILSSRKAARNEAEGR